MSRFRFDKAYYTRFYGDDPSSRVISEDQRNKLGCFLAAYLDHLDLEVHSVLDAGCGTGDWQPVVAEVFDEPSYTGLEVSAYACERHGWIQGSVADWQTSDTFDLVICQGVLQYLNSKDAAKALTNLSRWANHAIYLEALTEADWTENCDRDVTDGNVFLRAGSWYRDRLRRNFFDCGGGLFVKKDTGIALFELEAHG